MFLEPAADGVDVMFDPAHIGIIGEQSAGQWSRERELVGVEPQMAPTPGDDRKRDQQGKWCHQDQDEKQVGS